MQKIFIIILLVLFVSCDPAKRISRIVKRHPELVKVDTVWKKDTIISKVVQHDSLFHFYQPDTVYIKEGKLTVKYIFNKDSTVYIQGKCDADTVFKYYPVQVNSLTVAKALTWQQKLKVWLFDNCWWLLGILWLVWKLFGKAIKAYFPWFNLF